MRTVTRQTAARAWGRLSLRIRLVLLGTTGLAAGLAVGGALLMALLGIALDRSIDQEARRTAQDVVELVTADVLPEVIPVTGGHTVQVLDARNRVHAASLGGDRLVPLLDTGELALALAGRPLSVGAERVGETGSLRVTARLAGPQRLRVVVATPVAATRRGTSTLRDLLLLAYPPFIAALALLAWYVVGAALRPVEALRTGAERIGRTGPGTSRSRGERLPVPASDDEIGRLAVTLNGMLDRLEASQERQRAFVADAAHELRSPLATLRTELDVARRLGEPAPVAELLLDVDRLTRLVDDLLLLARTDGGGLVVRPCPVDLADLLADVARRHGQARVEVRGPVAAPGVRAGAVPAGDPVVEADPFLVRRLVTNLVDNAVRHAASRVTLGVEPRGGTVAVWVRDDGPGVPEADRARVFDRFTRLDDARSRDGAEGSGGSGLGLAIVRELVRLHGGEVFLHDARPGLAVEVRLPRGRPPNGPDRG